MQLTTWRGTLEAYVCAKFSHAGSKPALRGLSAMSCFDGVRNGLGPQVIFDGHGPPSG